MCVVPGRNELACDDAVVGNDASNSFAVSSTFRFSALVICVGADTSPCSSSAVRDGSANVGTSSEAPSSMKPCCVWRLLQEV